MRGKKKYEQAVLNVAGVNMNDVIETSFLGESGEDEWVDIEEEE